MADYTVEGLISAVNTVAQISQSAFAKVIPLLIFGATLIASKFLRPNVRPEIADVITFRRLYDKRASDGAEAGHESLEIRL